MKDRTEYYRQWRANNREKIAAAKRRYYKAHPYVSRKQPDPTGRLITERQEQIYRLVHPDFYNLPYWAAAMLVGVCIPLYPKCPENMKQGINRPAIHYEKWMDSMIVEKF
jgi:hypothetical protein